MAVRAVRRPLPKRDQTKTAKVMDRVTSAAHLKLKELRSIKLQFTATEKR